LPQNRSEPRPEREKIVQTNELIAEGNSDPSKRPQLVASRRWFAGFMLITAGMIVLGILAQRAPVPGSAPSGQMASHQQAIPIYLTAIFMDWALLSYCWAGVHRRGASIWSLAGGRWTSWKSVAADVGIALPFWLVWEGAAYAVHWILTLGSLGSGPVKTVDSLLPQSLLEVIVWIATCVTAGICEEMVFRGFVQRQLHALSGSLPLAVLGQGVIFGLFHAYQGWRNVVVISVLGILFGMLAAWRGNLRVNILTHAWTDFWEGWLKFLVFRAS
jgi:CAAX protease family protein